MSAERKGGYRMAKKSRKLLSLLILSSIFAGVFITAIPSAHGLSTSGVDLFIEGDDEVFVNETIHYEVEIGGVFGRDAKNWSLKAEAKGDAVIEPKNINSNESNTFIVNLTVTRPGKVTVTFTGYCSDGEETRTSQDQFQVKAVKPATVKVTVENTKDIYLENVTVGLFIDDELVQSRDIKLKANQSKTVHLNWSKEGLSDGGHKLVVGVNYGLDSNEYNSVLEKTIYIGEQNFPIYNWSIAISMIVLIVLFLFYLRKKRKRRRPW